MAPLLDIRDLSVNYCRNNRTIKALQNVSLRLDRNETVSIVGESGCGKSTLAHSILRLINKTEGEITGGSITFSEESADILKMGSEQLRQIRGKKISIIFQDPFSALNPVITAGEQITETLSAHDDLRRGRKFLKQEALNIIEKVRLPDPQRIYDSYPHQLSGGQRQRVCIAIAISTNPEILLADEPTTALDVTITEEILALLWSLQNSLNMSIVFITHNLSLAFKHSGRILIMYAGQIVEEGLAQEIIKEPLHPYTRLLFDLLPSLDKKGTRLASIPGQVPDMITLPAGCRFQPRCGRAMPACAQAIPELLNMSETHKVRCILSTHPAPRMSA